MCVCICMEAKADVSALAELSESVRDAAIAAINCLPTTRNL